MKNINKFFTFCLLLITVFSFSYTANAMTEQQAQVKYKNARQQYLKEVNWYKTARSQFLTAKTAYTKFKNKANKDAYEQRARDFLAKTVDVFIKRLESLKTWVSNRDALAEADKTSIIAELDEDINWLQTKKASIATATPAEIRTAAKEVRTYWRRHRIKVKKVTGQIWGARLDWALDRFKAASQKAADKITELKEAGYNTTELESWLADVNDKIALAEAKYEEAKTAYQGITTLEDANRLFNQAHQFIKEAHAYLRQAHQDLLKIVQEMRKITQDTTTAPAE